MSVILDKVKSIDRKAQIKLLVYLILAVIVVGFIFSNSLKDREASSKMSTGFVDILRPILDPFNKMTEETFHGLVRKLAHGFEFAVLGVCSGGLMWCVAEMRGRYHISTAILFPLVIALADEFIQSFNDRSSEVRDVLIDFCGALVGLAVVSLIEYLILRTQNKKTGVI